MKHKLKPLSTKNNFSKARLAVFTLAFGLIGIVIWQSMAAPNPNLSGDLNGDNTVDAADLSILLSDFGTSNAAADINGDGTVDVEDLSALLSHYGQNYTPPSGPSITGRWYLSSSAFNTPIPANPPISPNSTAMIQNNPNWVLPSSSSYKQWLGPRQRYALSIQNTTELPTVPVKVDWSLTQYKLQCAAETVNTPIPSAWSSLFGSFSSDTSYDAAFAIVAPDGTEWDSWKTTAPGVQPYDSACPPDSYWHAVRDDTGNVLTQVGYCLTITPECPTMHQSGSGVFSGAGLILPQDTQTGQAYQHALNLDNYGDCSAGQPNPRYIPPAGDGDGVGTGTSCIPTGARIQLDPSIDVSTWPSVAALPANEKSWMIPLLQTMQTYGLIVEDSTAGAGSGGVMAAWASTVKPYVYPWDANGYGWGYGNDVPYDLMSHFRVIDWNQWTGT